MTAQLSASRDGPSQSRCVSSRKTIEALVDFLARELLQALGAEALAGKGAHDAAVEHGAAEGGGRELGLRGEITEEAAGKAVACAGGIDDLFKRQCRVR